MAAAAAASTAPALSLAMLVIMMSMVMGLPVASTAAFAIVGMIVTVSMATATSAAFVIVAVTAAAAFRLRLIDGELDFLKSQLLANTHDKIRRAVVRKVGRAKLNLDLFVSELGKGLRHFAIQDEGKVGIHLVLELGQLLLAAGPLAGFVHGEYHLVRGGIESHGIENRRIFKSGHKFAG